MADPGLEEFTVLMQRVHEGSPEAARVLFDRYGPHIRRVVRRRLDKKLRSRFDSIDFVQDVWTSFFAGPSRRAFDRPQALVAYLARMARNKVVEALRHRTAEKRAADREHSLDSVTVVRGGGLVARQDTPSHAAGIKEQWEHLLRGQPPHYQRILDLLRQGHSHGEIAAELGLSEKTVQRLIRRLNRRHDS
jgi:RNA polymerase sigma-70 factor (ECF subfamily)